MLIELNGINVYLHESLLFQSYVLPLGLGVFQVSEKEAWKPKGLLNSGWNSGGRRDLVMFHGIFINL